MANMANRDDAASIPGFGAPARSDGDSGRYSSAPTSSRSGGTLVPESVVSSTSTIARVPVNERTMISLMTDPLNDTNWAVWKACMRRTFTLCNVSGYVYGDIERPDPTLDPTSISAENWDFNDSYAAILISENISPSQRVYAGSDCSAHEMWSNLEIIHETAGPATITAYVRELLNCTAEEGDDTLEHLNDLRAIWERINTFSADDSGFSDTFFKLVICSSLPPSWDNFSEAHIAEVRRHATRDPFKNMSSQEFINIIEAEAKRRLKRKAESRNATSSARRRNGRGKASLKRATQKS